MRLLSVVLATTLSILVKRALAQEDTTAASTRSTTTQTTTTTTPTTRYTTTTTTTKSRRKKTKMRRSTTSPKPTKPPMVTKETFQIEGDHDEWLRYVERFRIYYCMKLTECTNDLLHMDRDNPRKVCGRDYVTRELAWFDHKCTLWKLNCKSMGMFVMKSRTLCRRAQPRPSRYVNDEHVDPPRIIKFKW